MRASFNRLKVPQKLGLLSIFFILPNVLMLYFFITGIGTSIEFARMEMKGIEYQIPLEEMLGLLPQHGRLTQTATHRQAAGREVIEKQGQIEAALRAIETADARVGRELQFTDEGLAKRNRQHFRASTLRAEWEDLRTQLAELTPEARAARHHHLLEDVRAMITHVGDMSNLILDPDLDSYYLMDATLLALPEATHRLAGIIPYGSAALQHPDTFHEKRQQLAIYATLMRASDLERITRSLQTALNEDANFYGTSASLQAHLPPVLRGYTTAEQAFITLTARIAASDHPDVTPEAYQAAGLAAHESSAVLWTVAEQELSALLQLRIDHYQHRRTVSLMVAGFALLAAVLFVTILTRSITRPLHRQAAELLAVNESLKAQVAERARAEQSLQESEARVRAVVDTALDAVVTMDTNGRIVGWNSQAEAIFGWRPDEALGRSLSETIVPVQHREAHERGLTGFLASGHGPVLNRRIEIIAMHRDGCEFDVELAITPLKTEARLEFSAFLRDISGRKRQEKELVSLNRQLMDASRQAGMAEVATGVLHNVGNVLNSVNVSLETVADKVRHLKPDSLAKVAAIVRDGAVDAEAFFASPQGGKLPEFLDQLAKHYTGERAAILGEMESLRVNVEHINEIVAMQQHLAGTGGLTEMLPMTEVIEDALRMNAAAFERHGAQLVREFDPGLPEMPLDRNKLLLILMNLIRNAKYACDEGGNAEKRIIIRAGLHGDGWARISVSDSGVGIPAGNLTRIFEHGFTTRKSGHGFGLHSSALAASEMGGSLRAHSDGPGHGATFTIDLPLHPTNP